MLKIEQQGPFEITISWEADRTTNLNEFYKKVKSCSRDHPDAVPYRGAHRANSGYYRLTERTMEEAIEYFEMRGEKDPEKKAVTSLANEVVHYLDGYELRLTVYVWVAGVEVCSSFIPTAEFSHAYWESESEAAEAAAVEWVETDNLIEAAKAQVNRLLDAVSETIAVKEGVSV